MIDAQGPRGGHTRPHLARRHNVEDGDARDTGGMIERKAVGDSAAAVVPGDTERNVPKPRHDGYDVVSHNTLGIALTCVRSRDRGPTVAPEIGRNDSEMLGEIGRQMPPHHVRLRVAVQQQQGRPFAADASMDRHVTKRKITAGEARKQW